MKSQQSTIFIDTHCHLDFPEFDSDRGQLVGVSQEQGVEYIINIGSSLEGSRRSLELAGQYSCVYAAIGIHPHEADSFTNGQEDILRALVKNKKIVAIGEIGLDYYKNYSRAQNQRPLFASLINLAKDFGLPLVVHCRQAEADTIKMLKAAMPLRAVVHCFSGDENFLHECLDLGFSISFTCNITYKKAEGLRKIARLAPLERIFLETDAPYLSPEGLRGRRNEPINVKFVAQELARIKAISVEEVARITTQNAKEFFHLP